MEEKKKRRWNIVDVVVIVVVVLVGAFFAWKTTRKTIVTMPVNNMGTIRFVIEVDGLRKDMYDRTAAMLPCQMAASGKLVEGFILESWANPVTLVTMKSKSPVNASMEETLEPEEGVEYVNAYYVCEAAVDLNDNLNLTGTQEIRLGRSYYLKSVDFEYSGTIISLEKFEEQFAVKYREQLEE
jgi:hypothetical protein